MLVYLLLKYLFLNNGFEDMCPNVNTFDPLVNLTAAVTSVKKYSRRLDRVLLKVNKQNKLKLVESSLVNTTPFTSKSNIISNTHPGARNSIHLACVHLFGA